MRPMTAEQHAVVEIVYTALAKQLDWPRGSGTKHSQRWWHEMMLAAFAEEQGWKPEYFPSLTGGGFVMVTRSKQSRLTKRQGSELIEFARAWAIEQGVVLTEAPAREEEFPPLEAYA